MSDQVSLEVELLPGIVVSASVAAVVTCPQCGSLFTCRGNWWGCPGHATLFSHSSLVRDITAAVVGVRHPTHQLDAEDRRIMAAAHELLAIMDAYRRFAPAVSFTLK